MKIRSVRHNNRKKVFEVGTSTKKLVFPFSRAAPTPTTEDPVTELAVDAEAGREAITYVLHSGRTGTVHELGLCGTTLLTPDHVLTGVGNGTI